MLSLCPFLGAIAAIGFCAGQRSLQRLESILSRATRGANNESVPLWQFHTLMTLQALMLHRTFYFLDLVSRDTMTSNNFGGGYPDPRFANRSSYFAKNARITSAALLIASTPSKCPPSPSITNTSADLPIPRNFAAAFCDISGGKTRSLCIEINRKLALIFGASSLTLGALVSFGDVCLVGVIPHRARKTVATGTAR